jgi:hypothetical protein
MDLAQCITPDRSEDKSDSQLDTALGNADLRASITDDFPRLQNFPRLPESRLPRMVAIIDRLVRREPDGLRPYSRDWRSRARSDIVAPSACIRRGSSVASLNSQEMTM